MSELTLEFLGHAAFVIRCKGRSLVIDSYPEGPFSRALALKPITQQFDYFVSSHNHVDHDGGEQLPGQPERLTDQLGETANPFSLRRIESDHDEYGGRRRGGKVDILLIEADGKTIVHASDIGRSPAQETVDAIRAADVLIVPVGGFFTVGAAQAWEWCLRCSPTAIVPMHYGSDATSLGLRDESAFLACATWPREPVRNLDLLEDLRPATIFVMEPTMRCSHQIL